MLFFSPKTLNIKSYLKYFLILLLLCRGSTTLYKDKSHPSLNGSTIKLFFNDQIKVSLSHFFSKILFLLFFKFNYTSTITTYF